MTRDRPKEEPEKNITNMSKLCFCRCLDLYQKGGTHTPHTYSCVRACVSPFCGQSSSVKGAGNLSVPYPSPDRYQWKWPRAMCIGATEVKFSDRCWTSGSEGVQLDRIRQSRTRVWGSKMIRYRRSPLTVNRACSVSTGAVPLDPMEYQSSTIN